MKQIALFKKMGTAHYNKPLKLMKDLLIGEWIKPLSFTFLSGREPASRPVFVQVAQFCIFIHRYFVQNDEEKFPENP